MNTRKLSNARADTMVAPGSISFGSIDPDCFTVIRTKQPRAFLRGPSASAMSCWGLAKPQSRCACRLRADFSAGVNTTLLGKLVAADWLVRGAGGGGEQRGRT